MSILLKQWATGIAGGQSWSSYWTTQIKSWNPVFFVEDTTNVVDGKFVDTSGNNKVLSASATALANDTITLTASDADIIAAVTAAGMYAFFYTDDATPKAIPIKDIRADYSNYIYVSRDGKQIALFATALSGQNIIDLMTWRNLVYSSNRFTGNLLNSVNYFTKSQTSLVEAAGAGLMFRLIPNASASWTRDDNVLDFSITKKTQTFSVDSSVQSQNLFNIAPGKCCGKVTIGFWIDKSTIKSQFYFIGFGTTWLIGASSIVLNATKTATNFSGKVDAVEGTWCHFTLKGILSQNASTNKLLADNDVAVTHFGTVGEALAIPFTDFVMINDWIDFNVATEYTDVFTSDWFDKKLCLVGDSISLGIYGQLAGQYLNFSNISIAGVAGGRMSNSGGASYWMPTHNETISGANADVYVIEVGTNDASSAMGSIDGTDYSKYLDSYNNMVAYLVANNPTAKIILCTVPQNLGGISGGLPVLSESQFNAGTFTAHNAGIKLLAAKHGVYVCDLEAERRFAYNTAKFFLSDGTHWAYSNDMTNANIIAKFIKDNL